MLKESSFIFPVTECVKMMVKVADTDNRVPLFEKKELEIKFEKCIPD